MPGRDSEGKLTFKYRWYHVSTGRTETNNLRVDSRLEFLEALNKWNNQARCNETLTPQWVYTEEA